MNQFIGQVGIADEVEVGCWIDTPHGEAVCIRVDPTYVGYRYAATRVHDNAAIWVENGDVLTNVSKVRGPDEESQEVVRLSGPYGIDENEQNYE